MSRCDRDLYAADTLTRVTTGPNSFDGDNPGAKWLVTVLRRRLQRLTFYLVPLPPSEPSRIRGIYAAYFAFLWAATALLLAASVSPLPAMGSLLFFGVAAATCSYYVVQPVPGGQIWAPSTFVLFASAMIGGPDGVLACAVGHEVGYCLRRYPGWQIVAFNIPHNYVTGVIGWFAFTTLSQHPVVGGVSTAALLAGGLYECVNQLDIALAIALDTRQRIGTTWVGELRFALPFAMGQAWAAAGGVLLYRIGGILGLAMVATSILLFQAFLVYLAYKVHQHDLENDAHHQARVRLLQDAIEASNIERERIAGDIHDGVVQDLVGLHFTLASYEELDPSHLDPEQVKELLAIMKETDEITRDRKSVV